MGYVRKPLKLIFADEEFDGLSVWSKRISFGAMETLLSHAEEAEAAESPAAQFKATDTLVAALLPHLIRWNFEVAEDPLDDDSPRRPVPLTMEGFREDGDLALALAIVGALVEVAGGVPVPLPRTSDGGSPSVEALTTLTDQL